PVRSPALAGLVALAAVAGAGCAGGGGAGASSGGTGPAAPQTGSACLELVVFNDDGHTWRDLDSHEVTGPGGPVDVQWRMDSLPPGAEVHDVVCQGPVPQ